jgi:hypothetical protein
MILKFKIRVITTAIILLILLCNFNLYSKDSTYVRRCGLSANFQAGLQPQTIIQVPIWIDPWIVIAPGLGIVKANKQYSDISIVLNPRLYTSISKVSTYIGFYIGDLMNIPDNGTSTNDILIGISYCGEYFFDPHFSIGIEAQLNGVYSDDNSFRFGNPGGFNVNTGMAIIGNVYF